MTTAAVVYLFADAHEVEADDAGLVIEWIVINEGKLPAFVIFSCIG